MRRWKKEVYPRSLQRELDAYVCCLNIFPLAALNKRSRIASPNPFSSKFRHRIILTCASSNVRKPANKAAATCSGAVALPSDCTTAPLCSNAVTSSSATNTPTCSPVRVRSSGVPPGSRHQDAESSVPPHIHQGPLIPRLPHKGRHPESAVLAHADRPGHVVLLSD